MSKLTFCATEEETAIIMRIVDRAADYFMELDRDFDKLRAMMDIEAAHCNGCPLRLEDLAKAPMFDFMHDIVGIAVNMDRDTGKLSNMFLPRYADMEKRRAASDTH